MKKVLYFISILLIFSCDVEEIYVDVYDPEQERIDSLNQRGSDKNLIFSYLDGKSIVTYDTTSRGVFYSIINSGENLIFPEVNDIVSINIAGYYTNDSIFFTNDSVDLVIFDTNQQSLAESIGYFDPTKYYSPLVYTYNGLGSFFPIVSDHGYLAQLSDFKTALGISLSKISENGRIKILMPSGNAYGDSGNTNTPIIPENAVLIFDVHLIKIRK
ncbi:MAG: FKBP-type peptidyl-prolyl cis-trans isomerase [Cytophagales bacterium]|tara:strand:+ start:13294 stop:13938 length:645 start_codon:yes stop_codon:yes gene_type:complete